MPFYPSPLAREFVPACQTEIWEVPADFYKKIVLEQGFEYELFVESDPTMVQEPDLDPNILSMAPTKIQDYSKFAKLLDLEYLEHERAFKKYAMYNGRASSIDPDQKFLVFNVPGLLDSSPPILAGDWVRLRYLKDNSICEALTRVILTRRKDSIISVAWHSFYSYDETNQLSWNLMFIPSGVFLILAKASLEFLQKQSYDFLFPHFNSNNESLEMNTQVPKAVLPNTLNFLQQNAIQKVLQRTQLAFDGIQNRSLSFPYLLVGPSGTGKTGTLAALIIALNSIYPEARILAVAPSQSAADTLALRLLKLDIDKSSIFRFNAPLRDISTLPFQLHLISHIDTATSRFAFPTGFLRYPIIVCTTFEASLLTCSGFTNHQISKNRKDYIESIQKDLAARNLPPYSAPSRLSHWTHLIIDEAAQATEPELAPAMHLVLAHDYAAQIVLAGDPKQLGPEIQSRAASSAGLSQSLMDRLYIHKHYAQTETHLTTLQNNYRSHPSLLMIPSALFYSQDLIPSRKLDPLINASFPCFSRNKASQSSNILTLPVVHTGWPFLFHAVDGKDSHKPNEDYETASWYNLTEARVIVKTIGRLVRSRSISLEDDIGVMTITRQQVICIRNLLRDAGFGMVNVGTVEDYQGMERNIIILSTVRSNPAHISHDISRGLGLINQPKRLNVSLSRAKDLLIIVGNPSTLALEDPLWQQILLFCDRNGLWITKAPTVNFEGPFEIRSNRAALSAIGDKTTKNGVYISELERTYRALALSSSRRTK
jgi:helicase MOV-10